MDPTRRQTLASLALAPALTAVVGRGLARAAETDPGVASPIVLVASDGGAAAKPPLRYGGVSPSPLLRLKVGRPARIALQNDLPGPTSLDLHGLRVSPPFGRAGPLGGGVAPGATGELALVPADAGTFWYHPWILDPHVDATAEGLAGVLIVDEPEPPAVDADLAVLVTDRAPDGVSPAERLRIDGADGPRIEVVRPGSRLRLRVVNGSTRLALAVTCRGATPSVVAIDGQPSALFRPAADTMPAGPGARFDLMVDAPDTPGAALSLDVRVAGLGPATATALVVRTEGDPRPPRGAVAALTPNPRLPAAIKLEASTRATLAAALRPAAPGRWTVNGRSGLILPERPLFSVKRGGPVTLTFTNSSPEFVSFRLHGFCLRILHDLDDGWDPYWRDSLLLTPGTTRHAAFVADLPGRWLIESAFFAQAAGGLRTWFEVT